MSFSIRPIRDDRKNTPSFAKRALTVASNVLKPLENVYALLRRKHDIEKEEHENHVGVLKKALAVLIAVLFAGLLIIGTMRVLLAMKVFSLESLVSVAGVELPTDERGFTNLLLLGEGGSLHEGVDLTDTIMLASIDAKGKQGVVLLSLPRDLWLIKTEKMGDGRINSLYRNYKNYLVAQGTERSQAESDALKQLGVEIGTLMDLPVHGVMKINFDGFVQAVDAIGGIDVVVPQDIVDTEYPGPNYTYETFSISAGPQHMDGTTALKYARSRHSTSDFSRSARQQQILSAGLAKVRESGVIGNVGKMTELFGIISTNFRSTLSSRELLGLASLGKGVDGGKITSLQLHDQNGLYGSLIEPGGFLYAPPREEFDGASVLLPVSIPPFPLTWKQLKVLTEVYVGHRELFMDPPSIAVLNADAKEGAARKLGGELYRYMFNVTETKNYPRDAEPKQAASYIVVRAAPTASGTSSADNLMLKDAAAKAERAKKAAAYLSALLQIPMLESPDTDALADGSDIAIVLTDNYTYQPLQDLVSVP